VPDTSPAALAVAAALPASAPGAGPIAPIASVIDEYGTVSYYYAGSGKYFPTYAEALAAYQAGLSGAATVDAPYVAMGVVVDRSTPNPRYFKDGVQGGVFNGQFYSMPQIQTLAINLAATGAVDNPYADFLSATGTTPSAGFGFEQYVIPAAIAAITYGAASGLVTAPASAPEYLSAAELAPAAAAPAAAPVAATAELPLDALTTTFSAPIPETVISPLPAGITPDMLATASPVAGTAPLTSIQPIHAPEYLLPAEVSAPMPAAVPLTPAELQSMGLVETAPGVFEASGVPYYEGAAIPESVITPTEPAFTYPPISEEYITPTTPAGEPGVPSTWYGAAAPGGGGVSAGGAAPGGGAPSGEPGAPGGAGGGGVPNAIKQALERFFAPRAAAPVATHPQTLLEAAGEYAQANPVTGFALALAIGAGIVGARTILKH
jgi:hypothetical protein